MLTIIVTGLQLVLLCPPWSDGKGKGQFTFQPAKKLIPQTDTSSLSPAAVQVLSTPLIAGSARLLFPLHRTVRIIANSGLVVEKSSNTKGDGRRQFYLDICYSFPHWDIRLHWAGN